MKLLRLCMLLVFILLCHNNHANHLQPFHISDVKLLDGPFYQAQQTDMKYMLELEPDRLLAPFFKDAGFKPLKPSYGNWENTGLDGHIGGHYLSALAMMYAATGNAELLTRINYMVDWLSKCQEKNGNGYVGGVPDGQAMWKEIAKGNIQAEAFSLNKKWVPLYNIHKLYAGLRDVYLNTGNKKSLDVFLKLCDWFLDMTRNLSNSQIQEMLKSEHGGLNEVFVDAAQISGNKKYLQMADKLSHRTILQPLLESKNKLTGLHANTQIPKVIGFKRYADATGNVAWDSAANFFWNTVIDDWTVSIGGNSVREHFHPANDFTSMIESNQGPETCNTYNMLRLTKLLFLSNPDRKYMDYYERALFNHILSSEHPTRGGFVYFTPMRPRHYRVYSQPQESFWCCVGSGLENHAKYGEMIYAHTDSDLYVNLFIASVLNWGEKGIKLTQNTQFPYSENTELKLELKQPKQFAIKIRKPVWLKGGKFDVSINNEKTVMYDQDEPYITLSRVWKNGDQIKVELPMQTTLEYLPDHSSWASILHGPIVLAAISDSSNLTGLWADSTRMGHIANGPFYPINEAPIIVSDQKDFASKIETVDLKQLTFKMPGLIYPEKYKNIELRPFYEIHEARYIIYWPVTNSKDLESRLTELRNKEKAKVSLETRTIDQVAPGEQQPESDHNFKGEKSQTGINSNKHWRDATLWLSYDLIDKKNEAKTLQVTYFGLDKDRVFDIFINDIKIATVSLKGDKGNAFFNVDYPLPDNIFKNNSSKLILKFVAAENSKAGGLYYIRLLK
jgi:uncharacterized protein